MYTCMQFINHKYETDVIIKLKKPTRSDFKNQQGDGLRQVSEKVI